MGAGSLSIWVHNLKDFEFIPNYTVGPYSGMAVRVGAGVESWEQFNHMAAHNTTVVAPGGSTVGAVGGWIAVAGHGSLTSKYGLGADQVLSINIVTADGRFLTVDPNNHQDLWWALRGGGPSEFPLYYR
jgi:FAD/FMN-containing dehydrogenase